MPKKKSAGLPKLGPNANDLIASTGKGIAGAVPFVGSIFAEIVTHIIPNQRVDRLEDFVQKLSERIGTEDPAILQSRLQSSEAVELFEEGAVQSSRAVSNARREQIARLVAHGMSGEEKDRIEAKRLLQLLQEIDDDQVIILMSYDRLHIEHDAFWEKHKAILEPVGAHLGSDSGQMDRATVYQLARDQLLRLGLVTPHYKSPKKGELPEFDTRTGTMKTLYHGLAPLGRLLLTRLGLIDRDED